MSDIGKTFNELSQRPDWRFPVPGRVWKHEDDGIFTETADTRLEGESKMFRNVLGNDSGPYAEFCTLVSSPDQWWLFDGYLYDGERVIAAVAFETETNCRALIDAANSFVPTEHTDERVPEALQDLILKYQDRIHDERELSDWYDGPLFVALRDFAREIVPASEPRTVDKGEFFYQKRILDQLRDEANAASATSDTLPVAITHVHDLLDYGYDYIREHSQSVPNAPLERIADALETIVMCVHPRESRQEPAGLNVYNYGT